MKNKIKLIVIVIICCSLKALAQTMHPPGVDWTRTDWYPYNPNIGGGTKIILADSSGEDWWYAHKNSYNGTPLKQDGFICAGYSSRKNWVLNETGGCYHGTLSSADPCELETSGNVKGEFYSAIAKISMDGRERLWYKQLIMGVFWNVIQTSDGGYLALGNADGTLDENLSPLVYNPVSIPSSNKFTAALGSCGSIGRSRHALVVKLFSNGNVDWRYIYGSENYGSNGGEVAYATRSQAKNAIETIDGNFIVVGYANVSGHEVPYMFEITDKGMLVWKQEISSFTGIGFNVEFGVANAISKIVSGSTEYYIVAGTINEYAVSGLVPKKTAWVYEFHENSGVPVQDWIDFYSFTDIANVPTATSGYNSDVYDMAVNNSGDHVFLPVIYDCLNCSNSTTWNVGSLNLFDIDLSSPTAPSISNHLFNSYTLHAYDLKIGITATEDGGCALVSTAIGSIPSTVQTNPGCSDAIYSAYNADPLVVKIAPNLTDVEWSGLYPRTTDIAPVAWPNDYKLQECMFTITTSDDGGYIIAGNNSRNFDDCYLVKLKNDCEVKYVDDLINNSGVIEYHVPDNIIAISGTQKWSTSRSVLGSVLIPNNAKLTISGTNTVIEFADTRKTGVTTNIVVEPGGELVLEQGAKLTSMIHSTCGGEMWDGIEVSGDPAKSQSTFANQGHFTMDGGAVIENARLGAIADEGRVSEVWLNPNTAETSIITFPLFKNPSEARGGGIMDITHSAKFLNCRRSVHFAPFKYLNQSKIDGAYFSCTAPMNDPDYTNLSGQRLGASVFVSINGNGTGPSIKIWNNYFENSYAGFSKGLRGRGLAGGNSRFNAKGNQFKALDYGIDVYNGLAPTFGCSIIGNTFTDNVFGAHLYSGAFHQVSNNTLSVPAYCFGIVTEYTGGFTIGDNALSGVQTGDYGVAVATSGVLGGTVGRTNNFYDFHVSTLTQGENDLLQIKCNKYYDANYCWRINGTLADQGTGCNTGQFRAGNTFNGTSSVYEIFSNVSFTYIAAGGSSNLNTVPTSITTTVNVPTPCNAINNLPDNESCADPIPCTPPCSSLLSTWSNETNEVIKQELFNRIMMAYLADSARGDSLLVDLLKRWNNDTANALLVQHYYLKGDTTGGYRYLDSLRGESHYDQFYRLYDTLFAVLKSGKTTYEFNNAQHLVIDSIANNVSKFGYEVARSIMHNVYGIEYPFVPEEIPGRMATFSSGKENILQMSIKPNPANETAIVSFSIPMQGAGQLRIMNLLGVVLDELPIKDKQESIAINVGRFKDGLYVLKLLDAKSACALGKLIVNN